MSQQIWTYKFYKACILSRVQAIFRRSPALCLCQFFLLLCVLSILSGCCTKPTSEDYSVGYRAVSDNTKPSFVPPPSFTVDKGNLAYNMIGTPEVIERHEKPVVRVNGERATLFVDEQQFTTTTSTYTNKIYRIHFPEVPFGLCNLHITTGNNPGLIFIYTIDTKDQIVLITTIHSCGCYLAFIPTTALAKKSYPENWPQSGQSVYGYHLPSIVPLPADPKQSYTFTLASGSHRIIGVRPTTDSLQNTHLGKNLTPQPMELLNNLPYKGSTVSFFETDGPRKGYVKNNTKPLERLLISWWAFDWYVGEDKAYGSSAPKAPPFYTSLKFWQRDNSDMKDFPKFLSYWGWKL